MAELTEVTANGKTIRTIAVESEDPACIAAALRALGLEGVRKRQLSTRAQTARGNDRLRY